MRIVDSSAWIEWLLASPTGHTVRRSLPKRDQWLVPTIIQLELAKWAYRILDHKKADSVIAFSKKCTIVPLDTDLALAAAALCREHKLATADAIVYATALAHGAELLTCDAHFKGLAGVVLVEKSGV
jgi:predicted nucleic acid-binding protein